MGRRNRISRRILWSFGRKSVSLQVLSDSLVGFVADLVGFVVPTKSEIGSLAAPENIYNTGVRVRLRTA